MTSLARNSCGTCSGLTSTLALGNSISSSPNLLVLVVWEARLLIALVTWLGFWRSPFSSSFPFVEKIGAGLGTIVTHKPVNKAVSMGGKGCMGVVMLILEILPITLVSWEIANLWRSCSSQVVGGYCYYYCCSWKCKKSGNNKVELFCSTVSCMELKVFLLLFLTFDGSIRT